MKSFLLFLAFFLVLSIPGSSQEYKGSRAQEIIAESAYLRFTIGNEIPDFMEFDSSFQLLPTDFFIYLQKQFALSSDITFGLLNKSVDDLGFEHLRYQAYFKGMAMHNSMIIVHIKNTYVKSFNGQLFSTLSIDNSILIDSNQALYLAKLNAPADLYKWEIAAEEDHLKWESNDSEASYFPEIKRILFPAAYPNFEGSFKYAYDITLYAHKPLFRKRIILDSQTGELLQAMDLIQTADVPAQAVTKYSGLQEITSDSFSGGFRLRESGRGNGINTYNMQNSTTYSSAVDFIDTDNYWNNFNAQMDEVATDAHWGTEMTYDYFYLIHNRNSINNSGFALNSYVHYGSNFNNAFWDGSRMTYGDGNGTTVSPLTALDITAHEITHGLTSFTANLDYAYESGAINESFSDIFGAAVEYYARPTNSNWTIGEDINMIIRSMSNPNAYGSPDTYHGNYWNFSSSDNGGVHTNSGVMNYWYYLLCDGGSGTNDSNHSYSVSPIGRTKADKIAFRTLVHYLTNTSQYTDARFFSILAAIDYYGACSAEVEAVTRAWYAVGVGPNYVNHVLADFMVQNSEFCAPGNQIQFNNSSINGLSFIWNFGDGNTSTSINPIHTYTNFGNYTVSLIADGGSCGSDTLELNNFITIDPANPCVALMNISGNFILSACEGTLFDSGGNNNYHNNTNSIVTIAPTGALAIVLNFSSFAFELNYDYLHIYDGNSIQSPLIGSYTGNTLPNNGQITSSTGAITIRQSTDPLVTEPGFELSWTCVMPNVPPVAMFQAFPLISCDGVVTFTDFSTNLPNGWFWDLGDGTTSQLPLHTHTYQNDGLYTVQLIVNNPYGSDTITMPNHILVNSEINPAINSIDTCINSELWLSDDNHHNLLWYSDELGEELIQFDYELHIPNLSSTLNYWVQAVGAGQPYQTGKPDNSGSGSYFSSPYNHHLVFDVYKDMKLVSVKVYSNSMGNRMIRVLDQSDNPIYTKIFTIPSGEYRVYLNLDLPPGTDYKIEGPTSPNLFRNNGGVNYPYNINQVLSIKYSSAGSGAGDPDSYNYYYYFYDWEVIENNCLSELTPVEISVSEPVVSNFNFQIDGSLAFFTSTANNADAWEWSFGDGNYSNSEHPNHEYQANGNYWVELIASNNCFSDTYSSSISITNVNIIENSDSDELTIYPNPSKSNFVISWKGISSSVYLEIFNTLGELLYSEIGLFNEKEIDISAYPDGIYQVRIRNDFQSISKKLIKVNY